LAASNPAVVQLRYSSFALRGSR